MHVIEVIPLARGSHIESLTYYSSTAYAVGTIIDVPIRKQQKRAVVVSVAPVSLTKTAVRTATFSLRKLPPQTKVSSLPPTLIETANQLMKTTPATLGAILFTLLPPEIRDGDAELTNNLPCIGTFETPAVSLLQATFEERMRTYRSYIRATFAHRGSVVVVVPASADVARLEDALSSGIENRIITFAPTHTKKQLARAYEALHDLSHAKLIIVTPTYAAIDRHDITAMIIEQCQSPFYKSKIRPYIDTREFVTTLARVGARQVLMGDLLPRTEEEYRRRNDLYASETETPKRLTLPGTLVYLEQSPERTAHDQFTLLDPRLTDALVEADNAKQRSLVLAARRGIAPLVACADCGHIFRCPDSGEPYSLIRTGSGDQEKRWFIAASAGRRIHAPDTCTECGSWRLRERGIGIQHLESVISKALPDIPLIVFDHITASTPRKAQRLISDFYDTKGGILLATTMVLPYVHKPVGLAAITSQEAMRTQPTWRAEEQYIALLLRLREYTTGSVYIQSRSPLDEITTIAQQGLVEQYYTEELALREALAYPPFTTFIHLTIEGAADALSALETEIQNHLPQTPITWYSAPQILTNTTRRYGLIRVKRSEWPDTKLMAMLRQLPPIVRIEVNPDRIV